MVRLGWQHVREAEGRLKIEVRQIKTGTRCLIPEGVSSARKNNGLWRLTELYVAPGINGLRADCLTFRAAFYQQACSARSSARSTP